MMNLKIDTKIVDSIPLMGLIDALTFNVIVPYKYFFIQKIHNHKDLSMNNFDNVYLLYENHSDYSDNTSRFCVPSEKKVEISKKKYSHLNFFYKGHTICRTNNLECLIDINENIIKGPMESIWDVQDELEDEFRELLKITGMVERGDYDADRYNNEKNDLAAFNDNNWRVLEEENLGYKHDRTDGNSRSLNYNWLGTFDYSSGLCKYREENKYGFINRYFFEVGTPVDYVFNDDELLQIGIINQDPSIQYVENDHQILRIQFVGNFIDEITNYPTLFLANDSVKQYFANRPAINDTEVRDRIYSKLDQVVLKSAPVESEEFMEELLFHLPFYLSDVDYRNKSNINELIKKHNDLFGLIPSSYIVIEKINGHVIRKKQYDLIPYREGDKYGYKNQFQELVVPCIYDNTEPVCNGFAPVTLSNKWGIINGIWDTPWDSTNEYGVLIADCIYDNIGDYSENLVSVCKDGKWGFIDTNANLVIPMIYDKVKAFSEGFAAVMMGNKASYVNKKGELLTPLIFENVDNFFEGFASVEIDGKHGVINSLGENATMMFYEQVVSFSEGLFMVKLAGKVGFINEGWDWVVENVYDMAFPFSEGLAVVVLNSKYGYVDRKGNLTIAKQYADAYDFKQGIARVFKDGKYGYINKQGATVIPFIYEKAEDFVDGYARVSLDSLYYGIINTNGEVIIPFSYDYVHPNCFSNGLVAVKSKDLIGTDIFGYLNKSGKITISVNYIKASAFINGIAYVATDSSSGFIDTNGIEYWKK